MTASVAFHILESSETRALDSAVCRHIAECVAQHLTVCVVTEDRAAAERVDTALWTFDDASFVPHDMSPDVTVRPGGPPDSPVLITVQRAVPADVLINLATSVPESLDTCPRVVEFVDADPARRDAGRRRFVAYRERGIPPVTHKIGK